MRYRLRPVSKVTPPLRLQRGLIEDIVASAGEPLAVADRPAIDRDAGHHRVGPLRAGLQGGESICRPDRQGIRRQRGGWQPGNFTGTDTAVDIAVVANPGLDKKDRGGHVARLAGPDGIRIFVQRVEFLGRRTRAQAGKHLARPQVLAQHVIAACHVKARKTVIRKFEQVALDRQHALARRAGIDCSDPEIEIEQRIAE